jgi:flagellum-specific ATP synthase
MLSRRLAPQAHWPAIDVLASISRSMNDLVSEEHRTAANGLKQLLAAYQQAEDLISIGAYQTGSNPLVDAAVQLRQPINSFLQQRVEERVSLPAAIEGLIKIAKLREALPRRTVAPVESRV